MTFSCPFHSISFWIGSPKCISYSLTFSFTLTFKTILSSDSSVSSCYRNRSSGQSLRAPKHVLMSQLPLKNILFCSCSNSSQSGTYGKAIVVEESRRYITSYCSPCVLALCGTPILWGKYALFFFLKWRSNFIWNVLVNFLVNLNLAKSRFLFGKTTAISKWGILVAAQIVVS